ncbi:MAG: hypothetical protein ABIP39_01095 [Polyangiaceae bacterium]
MIVVFVGFFGLALVLPFLLAMGTIGFYVGGRIPRPVPMAILTVLLGLFSFVGGVVSGVLGGAKQLTWETYKTYPVRHRTIFGAELIAGLGDPIALSIVLTIFVTLAGVAVAQPRTIPVLLVMFVEATVGVMVMNLLIASLAAALVRRLRVALGALALAMWMAAAIGAMFPKVTRGGGQSPVTMDEVIAAGKVIEKISRYLPTAGVVRSLADAIEGSWLYAALHHLPMLGTLLVLSVIVARLLAREADSSHDEGEGSSKLWSFENPVMGVARLQWATLLDSQLGRFGLVVPLITVVIIRGPFAQIAGLSAAQGIFAVPGAFVYLSLVTNRFQLNQFGLDGHGVKSLLLLPIAPRDLLVGKALGLGVYQGVQGVLLCICLALIQHPTNTELIAGVLMGGCLFFTQNAVGWRTSVAMPKRLPRRGIRSQSAPVMVALLALALSLACGTVFGGTFMLCGWFAPSMLIPIMAVLFLVSIAVHRRQLPLAASFLQARRETIVQSVG